jgi:hypothetical protein
VCAAIVLRLYAFVNDTSTISEGVAARFLRALKAAQAAHDPASSSTLDIEPFIPLARDLLGYLRTAFSAALLPLLRLFAASGGTQLALTAVSPDVLQREVQLLLNSSSLNSYYWKTASSCGTRRAAGTAGSGSLLADVSMQVRTEMLPSMWHALQQLLYCASLLAHCEMNVLILLADWLCMLAQAPAYILHAALTCCDSQVNVTPVRSNAPAIASAGCWQATSSVRWLQQQQQQQQQQPATLAARRQHSAGNGVWCAQLPS